MHGKNTPVAVIGGGVIGLTTGIRLLEWRFDVTLIARNFSPHTTSDVAGAVWLPYKIADAPRVRRWAATTFREYKKLKQVTDGGVSFTELLELFAEKTADPWWKEAVDSFSHAGPAELPAGFRDAYRVRVPLIDTPVYMKYLTERFRTSGGRLECRNLNALGDISDRYPLMVNCSGVWARYLAKDSRVFPIRGEVLRIRRPRGLTDTVLVHESGEEIVYIVPRGEDCILGGVAQENNWSLDPDPRAPRKILDRCRRVAPAIGSPMVLEHKVGLRPGRERVRLEREAFPPDRCLIHNYGHAGSGFTLAWGCADEVVDLATEFIG